jgi:predicted peptidase
VAARRLRRIGKAWPAILFLHGSGERGATFPSSRATARRTSRKTRGLPFVVIAPQLPAGETWSADALLALLDVVQGSLRIDTTRVYLTGLSMGSVRRV